MCIESEAQNAHLSHEPLLLETFHVKHFKAAAAETVAASELLTEKRLKCKNSNASTAITACWCENYTLLYHNNGFYICKSSGFPLWLLNTDSCYLEKYFLSRRIRTFVLVGRRLKFLRCVRAQLFGPPSKATWNDAGVGLCCSCFFDVGLVSSQALS